MTNTNPITFAQWKANNPDLLQSASECSRCKGRQWVRCDRCYVLGVDSEHCPGCDGASSVICPECEGDGTTLLVAYRSQCAKDLKLFTSQSSLPHPCPLPDDSLSPVLVRG